MLMTKGWWGGLVLMVVGLLFMGAGLLAGAGDKQPKIAESASAVPPADAKSPTVELSLAERFKRIRAEYDARQNAVQKAAEKTRTERERDRAYQEMSPDEAAYSRKMLDLALLAPADPVARDALMRE
jgi:hypothetical protein